MLVPALVAVERSIGLSLENMAVLVVVEALSPLVLAVVLLGVLRRHVERNDTTVGVTVGADGLAFDDGSFVPSGEVSDAAWRLTWPGGGCDLDGDLPDLAAASSLLRAGRSGPRVAPALDVPLARGNRPRTEWGRALRAVAATSGYRTTPPPDPALLLRVAADPGAPPSTRVGAAATLACVELRDPAAVARVADQVAHPTVGRALRRAAAGASPEEILAEDDRVLMAQRAP